MPLLYDNRHKTLHQKLSAADKFGHWLQRGIQGTHPEETYIWTEIELLIAASGYAKVENVIH